MTTFSTCAVLSSRLLCPRHYSLRSLTVSLLTLFFIVSVTSESAVAAVASKSVRKKSSRRRAEKLVALPPATLTAATEAERMFECAQKIEDALDLKFFGSTRFGVIVKTDEGKVIYERNQDKLFKPASNLKLITSAVALELLGPDFTYSTDFFIDGDIKDGVLSGDLIISGSADPVVSGFFDAEINSVVKAWANMLQEKGITRITGDVILDNSYYVGADVDIDAGESGEPIRFATVASFGRADAKQLSKVTRRKVIRLKNGKKKVVRRGFKRKSRRKMVTIEPNLYCVDMFLKELNERGVTAKTEIEKINYAYNIDRTTWHFFYRHRSKPLSELVRILNKLSDNFYADQVLRTLGGEYRGEATMAKGIEVEREFLREKIGVTAAEFKLADGSGLSHDNLVTPALLVKVMNYMKQSKHYALYYESLSIPCVDGTLAGRIHHELSSQIRAKTGSITGVTSLSGYLESRSGQNLYFSILCNSPMTKRRRFQKNLMRLEDQLCKLMLEI